MLGDPGHEAIYLRFLTRPCPSRSRRAASRRRGACAGFPEVVPFPTEADAYAKLWTLFATS